MILIIYVKIGSCRRTYDTYIHTRGVSYLDCTVDTYCGVDDSEHKIPVASVVVGVCILTKKWCESNKEKQPQALLTKYIIIKKNILLQIY